MESLQNGRMDFGKGQPIVNIDRVCLHMSGSWLSSSCFAPVQHSWDWCGQPAPGIIVKMHAATASKSCNVVQSFAIFGGVYAFASCIAQRLRQKQDGEPLSLVELFAYVNAPKFKVVCAWLGCMLSGMRSLPSCNVLRSLQWWHSGLRNRAGPRMER